MSNTYDLSEPGLSQRDEILSSYLILSLGVESKCWLNQEMIATLRSRRRINGIKIGSMTTDVVTSPEDPEEAKKKIISRSFQAAIALAGARVLSIICRDASKCRYYPWILE